MPAPFHSNDERTVFFLTLDIYIYIDFEGRKAAQQETTIMSS